MEWTAVLQGVRMMRFRDVFGRCEERELSQLEAAELLGVPAFLVDEEGTMSSFRELGEVFTRHGLPCSFYTDRGSHYFHTPKAGGKVDKAKPQVGRALPQFGIVSFGQRFYKLMNLSNRCCCDHFFIRSIDVSVPDVVTYRTVEKKWILFYRSDGISD